MPIDQALIQEVEAYATDLLEKQHLKGFVYHTLEHTRSVVFACKEIGINSDLSEEQLELLEIAGWFHDLGYISVYNGHEEESKRLATDFLAGKGLSEAQMEQIMVLIEATKLDSEPVDFLGQVIKDADLYNLSTPQGIENSDALRSEWETFLNINWTNIKWAQFNLDFYENHIYYTAYGKEVLKPRKELNIRKLKKILKKQKNKEKSELEIWKSESKKKDKRIGRLEEKLQALKIQKPDRGIETMFRVTYRTHINLSSIADNKANILLSINALIISFIVPKILENLDEPQLVIPMMMFIPVCLATIIYAILATRPKVNSGIFTREDILQKRTNLLFFGNFYNMGLDDYLWGMSEMMRDSDYLYGSMSKDIYFLGKVLAKRFQRLRVAYNIFMYGTIAAVSAAMLVYFLIANNIISIGAGTP